MDRTLAHPDFSADGLYYRSWLRVGSADYRVASFNAGSGAFLSAEYIVGTIFSGMDFEVYGRIAPSELDTALDETILEQRVRREVGINTIDGATFYTLDGAASPHTVINYLDVYYFANPSSSVNRDRRNFLATDVVRTASGIELRIPGGLRASQQLVIDALLQLTLGAGDGATINLDNEDVVLWGAAAKAYDVLIQNAPSQEAGALTARRQEAARMYTNRMRRWLPVVEKPLGFEQAFAPDPLE